MTLHQGEPVSASPRAVLLARPHQFIVGAMSDVLVRNGYLPVVPGSDGSYPTLADPALRGAIISTAVKSSVPDDHLAVYLRLRAARPDLALVFATLVPVNDYVHSLRGALGRRVGNATVVTFETVSGARWAGRGPGDVLLLDKHDVETGGAPLDQALRAWFG